MDTRPGPRHSGDPTAIECYMGSGAAFDNALTAFAAAYADQNQADFDEFIQTP